MKILVCVKVINGELNPFDACALEEALRLGGEVSVLSMCPASAESVLRPLTRLGVKNVYLLSDSVYAGSDTLATSYILSLAAQKIGFDLILCGRQTIDGDTAQVGPCLATKLGIGLITNVLKLTVDENTVSCETRSGEEKAELPALLTVERINTLRFPSIFSRLGEVTVLNNSDVGADPSKCGLHGSPTKVLKVFEAPAGQRQCKFIKPSELRSVVAESLKKDSADVNSEESEVKLPYVIAVGETVAEKARLIADKVKVIDCNDPYEIANIIKAESADVVLWNADLWGRKNAPIVAALLETGLCADCTHLETDGKKLFMYRPAKSGSVIAKIECVTSPQMATVRCDKVVEELIVSGGRGVAEHMDEFNSLVDSLGGAKAASRALVDMNCAPYSHQIGLTGKNASAKVYVAVGISGAVQHTCALDAVGTVIAINPDKDARIFEYADFGIVASIEEVIKNI